MCSIRLLGMSLSCITCERILSTLLQTFFIYFQKCNCARLRRIAASIVFSQTSFYRLA
uniref:Uncharacterized protein n=1 Tax=Anguilla anguilla TaxID=7936 RepID=A0A0E9PPM3_ANGAN